LRFASIVALLIVVGVSTGAASAKDRLVEPHMHFSPDAGVREVALTLDACMGGVDMRILGGLIDNGIPATIFATRRWLVHNPDAVRLIVDHADLFEIEDHGAEHVPAIIGTEHPFGIAPAGTAQAVTDEVLGGAQAVTDATRIEPHWYRGATALYTQDAVSLIKTLGFRVAGFSLNGDIGASVSTAVARSRIARAKSGDVILSHINQPTRAAGQGVIEGVLALKAKGFRFVRLRDVTVVED
jgi:peptidoglycan/xylan/chitin deacetylase (PgdA/CDA1 family)